MINTFQELTTHSGFDYKDYVQQLNLLYIFGPIFERYEDVDLCTKIVKFIAYAHSVESNKLSVGGDRRKELHRLFKELGIPDNNGDEKFPVSYYDEVVLMESPAVVNSVQLWMQYKDNRQLEYLFTLQNAYMQQQSASLKSIRKSTGEVDYDQKFKCIGHMMELKKMIKDAESELQQNDPKLRESYEEVKMAAKKVETHGPEKHAW